MTSMRDPSKVTPPAVTTTIAEIQERISDQSRDLHNLVAGIKRDLLDLQIYASERGAEVKGHYRETEASRAYKDMSDRIQALLRN